MAIASPVEPRSHTDWVTLPDAVALPLDWGHHERTLRARLTDIKAYGDCLEAARRTLEAGFRSGVSVVELVHGRAAIIDRILALAWEGFGLEARPDMALIAVGGYGRGELHPGSDVDLLLLHDGPLAEETGEAISRFLTFLWDIGLQVGHSVRSLEDLLRKAARHLKTRTMSLTLASRGALIYDASTDAHYTIPVFSQNVVDRIGAGDAFAAGLIHARGPGRSETGNGLAPPRDHAHPRGPERPRGPGRPKGYQPARPGGAAPERSTGSGWD